MTRRDGPSGRQSGRRRVGRDRPPGVTGSASGRRLVRSDAYPDADAPFEKRLGYCYVLAARYVIKQHRLTGPIKALVHGTIQQWGKRPIDHAWVEFETGQVWEPITNDIYDAVTFDVLFHPRIERTYTVVEAARAMVLLGNYGPWHHDNPESHKEKRP